MTLYWCSITHSPCGRLQIRPWRNDKSLWSLKHEYFSYHHSNSHDKIWSYLLSSKVIGKWFKIFEKMQSLQGFKPRTPLHHLTVVQTAMNSYVKPCWMWIVLAEQGSQQLTDYLLRKKGGRLHIFCEFIQYTGTDQGGPRKLSNLWV